MNRYLGFVNHAGFNVVNIARFAKRCVIEQNVLVTLCHITACDDQYISGVPKDLDFEAEFSDYKSDENLASNWF